MVGAELATIIGIVSSFVTCFQYAQKLYDKAKERREHARVQRLAEQLGQTLQGGHIAIEAALERLRGLGHVFGGGNGAYFANPSPKTAV
jgi:hypothetical protein